MFRHLKKILILLFIIIILTGFSLTSFFEEKTVDKQSYLLNTLISIKASGDNAEEAIEAAMARITEIENAMSAHIEDTDVWAINHSVPMEETTISEDTFMVIKKGIHYSKLTNGYFDITVKALVDLWGIGTENPRVPTQTEIRNALNDIDYKMIAMNEDLGTIKLKQENMGIDLGGIAKGYAADEVVRILKEHGVQSAYADLGGNIVIVGKKSIGWKQYLLSKVKGHQTSYYQDWRIGIQDPLKQRGSYMAVIALSDKAVVTSGPYERYFEQNGTIYHHILDPFSGYPAENGIISATIIADKSIDADALSTSIFLLGEKKGVKLIESLPDIEAIIVNEDKKVSITKGLEGKVIISNDEYRFK